MATDAQHDDLAKQYTIDKRWNGWWYTCKICSSHAGYSNLKACLMYADRHILHDHTPKLFDQDAQS